LIELKVMAGIIADPHKDWSWIYQIASRVRVRCEPARSKRHRLRHIGELWSLGLDLMDRAKLETTPLRCFKTYRDGLLIALLSALPTLRLANLTGLYLGRTLVWQGENWIVGIPASAVKTKVAIEVPWPRMLIPHLDVYLSEYRSWVLELRRPLPAADALWVTMYGLPMHDHTIYMRIMARTRAAFGRAINPHLFRDCAVTTVAIEDPAHVRITAPLLHHRTFATTEKYYNQAQAIEASRLVQTHLISLRRNANRVHAPKTV
jgi:site-specific recombinase XerD